MKKALLLFTAALLCTYTAVQAQFIDITTYDTRHPQYVTKDAVSKTSNLRVSSDCEFLKVQLCVRDASLQQRFKHEGITFYIDPTGKKCKDNVLHFQGMGPMGGRPPQHAPKANEEPREAPSPNNQARAILVCANDTIQLPAGAIDVSNDDCGYLTFTAIIPCEYLTKDKPSGKKWQIGIFSEKPSMAFGPGPNNGGGRPDMNGQERPAMPQGQGGGPGGGPGMSGGGPGMSGGGPGMHGGGPGMHGGPQGGQFAPNESSKSTVSSDKIENWIKISYSDIIK